MNVTIELLQGVAIVKNKGNIPLTNDPLTLSIFSRNYIRDNLFITATINGQTSSFEIVDGIAVMPEKLKQAGTLKLTVRMIVNGETLQTWRVEDILIFELEGKQEAIPQVAALTKKVEALTEAVAELKTIIIENGGF